MAITSLAVFCGSKEGNNPLFCEHAKELGYILAAKKYYPYLWRKQ